MIYLLTYIGTPSNLINHLKGKHSLASLFKKLIISPKFWSMTAIHWKLKQGLHKTKTNIPDFSIHQHDKCIIAEILTHFAKYVWASVSYGDRDTSI